MLSGEIDRLIEEHRLRYQVTGISVAVADRGVLLHATGQGLANVEWQAPATADTVYQTASAGKQFTAALIMLLVQRGMLGVDDLIAPHFDPAPAAWSAITVRHLLTHTSGISDAGTGRLNLRLDYSDEQILAAIASAPLAFQPGSAWDYSNSGYILLGLLAARITGRFYGDLLHDWIFEPLGMSTARVISERDIVLHRAAGYLLSGGQLRNQEYVSPTLNRTADGALYVTVLDMMKWDRELATGTLLSRESRQAMWTPVTLVDGSTYPYGFGWSVERGPHGLVVEHDGDWQGFATHFVRYVDAGLGIVVMANLADVPVSELALSIADQHFAGAAVTNPVPSLL